MLGAAIPPYPPPFFLPTPIKKERGNISRIFAPSTLLCHLTFLEMRRLPDIAEGKIFPLPLLSSAIMLVGSNYFYQRGARGQARFGNAVFIHSARRHTYPTFDLLSKKERIAIYRTYPLTGPCDGFARR